MRWLTQPSHFFNPYPCAATKHALATETNLREDQIANWFVNTRKRFLTPIIADVQRAYGGNRSDSVVTKRDLYTLLADLVRDKTKQCSCPSWISSFLSDSSYSWFDENQ